MMERCTSSSSALTFDERRSATSLEERAAMGVVAARSESFLVSFLSFSLTFPIHVLCVCVAWCLCLCRRAAATEA